MTQKDQYTKAAAPSTLPHCINEITIKRSEYNDTVYVAMKSGLWEAKFSTPESNLHQRIHEIAAEMERTQ